MRLAWGQFKMWSTPTGSSQWKAIYTPVEDSLQLTTNKGDKLEAKIEGGEAEAVKYKRNTHTLEFEVRLGLDNGKMREKPWEDKDGVIDGEHAIMIQPEDKEVAGIKIDRCTLSSEVTYSAADGIIIKYTAEVLKPDTGNQIKLEVITDPASTMSADVKASGKAIAV